MPTITSEFLKLLFLLNREALSYCEVESAEDISVNRNMILFGGIDKCGRLFINIPVLWKSDDVPSSGTSSIVVFQQDAASDVFTVKTVSGLDHIAPEDILVGPDGKATLIYIGAILSGDTLFWDKDNMLEVWRMRKDTSKNFEISLNQPDPRLQKKYSIYLHCFYSMEFPQLWNTNTTL